MTDSTIGDSRVALLEDYSLEITGKDVGAFTDARDLVPGGTRVNVTYLGNEHMQTRVGAAQILRGSGFRPVPHVSARRLRSRHEFEDFLAALCEVDASEEIVIVGGDPARPEGPYEDALSLLRTDLLGHYGVRRVGITGYPEGHPHIGTAALWHALEAKARALREQGLECTVLTQFAFDADPVLNWLDELRGSGVDAAVRIGVPGPAGIRRLLGYARRFGVQTSAGIVAKYGFSLTNLMGSAGPERFVDALSSRLDTARHGPVSLHFYTFGGIRATAQWVHQARWGMHR